MVVKPGFLDSTPDILGPENLLVGCPVRRRRFRSTCGLCLPCVSTCPRPNSDSQTCPGHRHMSPGRPTRYQWRTTDRKHLDLTCHSVKAQEMLPATIVPGDAKGANVDEPGSKR